MEIFFSSYNRPWVDFIGVPKPTTENGIQFLDLIRPKEFAEDNIEALFFDEFNRSHKKVRNAVMELIQFKSINGKKFNNLKIIWAAINPDDEETYDVEKIDPAQLDRFHVHCKVDYKCDSIYFKNKYGNLADSAISWWNELDPKFKDLVSPRRLDYALDLYNKKGDLRDILPPETNISKLLLTLQQGPVKNILENLYTSQNLTEAQTFIENENNYEAAIHYLKKDKNLFLFFLPFLAKEKLASLLTNNAIFNYIITSGNKIDDKVKVVLTDFYKISATSKQKKLIDKHLNINGKTNKFSNTISLETYKAEIENLKKIKLNQTPNRIYIYEKLLQMTTDKLDDKTITDTMNLLDKIIVHSHNDTVKKKMSKVSMIINMCIKAYKENHLNDPFGTKNILDSYPSIRGKLAMCGFINNIIP